MYEAYITRFRPKGFGEVVGQEGIAETLRNAVRSGRVANGYLFAGPRGVGKTSTARILAKALNCEKGPTPDPCNKCSSCVAIHRGDDLDVIEIDAASNTSVDNVRALRENAIYAPSRSRYKVYIIDEAHMLSVAAMNALLKILEEPPSHVRFIFATTDPNRIPETVRSRLQRFDFRPIGDADTVKRLRQIADEEKIQVTDEILSLVARHARGGLRDAEGLLDQLVTLCSGREVKREDVLSLTGAYDDEVLAGLLKSALNGDAAKSVDMLEALLAEGGSPVDLLEQLHGLMRAVVLYLAGQGKHGARSLAYPDAVLKEVAGQMDLAGALNLMSMLGHYRFEMRYAPDPAAVVEMAVLRIACRDALADLAEVAEDAKGNSKTVSTRPPEQPGLPRIEEARRGSPGAATPVMRAQAETPSWWPDALKEVADIVLRKQLSGVRVTEISPNEIVISVPTRMLSDMLSESAKMEELEAAALKAAGRKVRISLDTVQALQAQRKSESGFGMSVKSKAARRLIDEFGGTIESIEKG